MSTQTEITRLLNARNTLRNKGVALGIALETDNLTELAIKYEGMVNQGAVHAEVKEGETFTVSPGYHNGSGTVSGIAGGGNYSLQLKTITPTKSEQDITSDEGYYGLSGVTVHPIPSAYQDVSGTTATADDVLETKLFTLPTGVLTAGTMRNNGAINDIIDGLTTTSFLIPKGYHSGAGVINLTNDIEQALMVI